MHNVPLPRISTILKALNLKSFKDEDVMSPWVQGAALAGLLSKSSWSLALICLWRKKFTGKNQVKVWVPEYFCEQSLDLLRAVGSDIKYYPIYEDLTPNLTGFKKMKGIDAPDILVGVHYFGKPNKLSAISDFAKINSAWVVEDAVHVLRPIKGVGSIGDFVMYSPHKHLPIRNGSILLVSKKGPSMFENNLLDLFGDSSYWCHFLENKLQPKSGHCPEIILDFIWIAKRLIQKLGYFHFSKLDLNSVRRIIKYENPKISNFSKKFLYIEQHNLENIHYERYKNQIILDDIVKKIISSKNTSEKIILSERSDGQDWSNYLCGYEFPNKDLELVAKKLYQAKIVATKWPDLADEVSSNENSIANKLFQNRLYLSNNNRIKAADVAKIFSTKKNKFNDQINIKTSEITIEKWNQILLKVTSVNYLQEHFYCNLKSNCEGWKAIKVLYSINDSPIAVLQYLKIKKFIFFTIIRINRGPILLRSLKNSESEVLWRTIGKHGSLLKCRILSIAPQLDFTAQNIGELRKAGFMQVLEKSTESSVIDLSLSVEFIRSNFKASWRAILKEPTNELIEYAVSESEESYLEAVDFYQKFRDKKNFDGPDILLLRKMYDTGDKNSSIVTFLSKFNGEIEAVVCILLNRKTSTYLIGGSTGNARKLKIGYQLIWNAILYSKFNGMLFFDVGGLDFLNNPGVSRFKAGMGGKNYMLVGEYIKF
jgi:lipid II:glycine glycyltransferase (peptidoglycan interpeptide bridge formation enzyme)